MKIIHSAPLSQSDEKPEISFKMPARNFSVILIVLLHLCTLLFICHEPMMINNGDYHRVSRLFVDIPSFSEVANCSELKPEFGIFRSTMGALFTVIAGLSYFSGFECFLNKIPSFVLFAILASGSYAAIRHSRNNTGLIAVVAGLSAVFSFLFSSYYEEAIVLPLVAWAIFGASRFLNDGKPWTFVFACTLLVFAKTQMMIFLPFFVFIFYANARRFALKPAIVYFGIFFMITGAFSASALKTSNQLPNAYNRFYNGIGWSLQDVGAWPATNFDQRFQYFAANKLGLQSKTMSQEFPDAGQLMGTSYWPVGVEIFESKNNPDHRAKIKESIDLKQFFNHVLKPDIFPLYFKSIFWVAAKSDYSIEYLYSVTRNHHVAKIEAARALLLRHFGAIYMLAAVIIFLWRRSCGGWLAALYYAGFPVVVVLGDGFYEFEKHLLTFLLASPVLFLYRTSGKIDIHNRPHRLAV